MTNIYKAFNGTPQCDSNYALGWFVGSVQKAMILIVTSLVRTNGFEPNANRISARVNMLTTRQSRVSQCDAHLRSNMKSTLKCKADKYKVLFS